MNKWSGKTLKIGDLEAKLPIVQGGMGVGVSLSGLAAAVANEGGIGVISTAAIGMDEPDFFTDYLKANNRALKNEIKKARELTNGILGVNIMRALTNYEDMVNTAIEEKIDIIFVGAGLPTNLPSFLNENSTTKLVPIISKAKAVDTIIKLWYKKYNYIPDAFVVEGPKAGGHLGYSEEEINDPTYALENTIVDVIEKVKVWEEAINKKIPVIAGGGIYTGEDIFKFMQLGASGVQMGTRFVTTNECDASIEFKQAYINCQEKDITIIKSPVGMPGRAIENDFIKGVKENGNNLYGGCPYQCIITCNKETRPYCIALALINAKKGKMEKGFAFAGSNAYRAATVMPVHELINTLEDEYNKVAPIEEEHVVKGKMLRL